MDAENCCECKGPGFCSRYQIEQQQYPWEVCQGAHGAEKGSAYRRKWASRLHGPNSARKAANVIVAIGRAVSRAATGQSVLVPPNVAEERLTICRANTCGFYIKERDECKKCGCGMQKRLTLGVINRPGKTELAGESCPVGLWSAWSESK